jgi:putative ABC transport system ATP-binding protein
MSLLRIENLHHRYAHNATGAEVVVLRGVSLEIARGEFAALMGPSGCGKSTLLHVCGAMQKPTEGRIVLAETDITTATEETLTHVRRDSIGFIFQTFNLLPTLTVLENAALPMRLAQHTAGEAESAARTWLDRVGLGHRQGHFPSQLSGGERQRVAVARAFLRKPPIILADEPTGSLDSENGQAVATLLQEMNQEHQTAILMATHDAAVAAVAQRILRMQDGKLVA